jgi:flagellar biosynthesis protein FlhA
MQAILNNMGTLFKKYTEIIVGLLTVMIIGIIIIPMPSLLLDLLLVINISLGVIILLLTLSAKHVLEFSTFPTILLIATMFRLALNISSTRLILSYGDAGYVINAFGEFVTGNNYIVGAIIFLIIVIVQMVVVTAGASRVSEVSARFTLDAMPGKQMAIDADLNTGIIDEEMAKKRRQNLQREADFYGAMDGASKFVKGDAVAGVIITIINLVGGILIFSIQRGMGALEALEVFGKLTIGDGLVSQIPALLISVASGVLVTRSDDGQTFGKTVMGELFSTAQVLMVAAFVLFIIALVPAFPTPPFIIIAVILGAMGYLLKVNEEDDKKKAVHEDTRRQASARAAAQTDTITSFQVEPISLEIGYGLISLVDEGHEDNLISQITSIRKQIATELGMLVNPIRIRDNLQLPPNEYVIKIKGNTVATGEIFLSKYLVLDPGNGELQLEGVKTTEPAFGMAALWIEEAAKERAELEGLTIVEPSTVLVTHLKETIKKNAPELLGRQEVKLLLEGIKESHDVVINELIPDIMTLGDVQKVLQGLLREHVPIYDLVTILESLADNGRMTKDIETLTEQVRHSLKRTIVKNHLNRNGILEVVTIHPDLEDVITDSVQRTMSGSMPVLKPDMITKIFDNLSNAVNGAAMRGSEPAILTSPRIRTAFKNLISFNFPNLSVLSITEVPNDVEIEAVGLVDRL